MFLIFIWTWLGSIDSLSTVGQKLGQCKPGQLQARLACTLVRHSEAWGWPLRWGTNEDDVPSRSGHERAESDSEDTESDNSKLDPMRKVMVHAAKCTWSIFFWTWPDLVSSSSGSLWPPEYPTSIEKGVAYGGKLNIQDHVKVRSMVEDVGIQS